MISLVIQLFIEFRRSINKSLRDCQYYFYGNKSHKYKDLSDIEKVFLKL